MNNSDDIIDFYDNFAESYDDKVFSERDYTAFELIPSWILEKIENKEPAEMLDLGCGTGLGSLEFLKVGHHVTGIDISSKMITESAKHPFHQLICQSLEAPLPFKDHRFNVAIMLGVMEFIQNPPKLFKEVARVLTCKGLFGLTLPKKLPQLVETELGILTFKPSSIEKTLLHTGFQILKTQDFQGFISKGTTVSYRGYLLESSSIDG